MKYFITGGCGFLGSNLAAEVLRVGDELCVFDNLSREGSETNLSWLRMQGNFEFFHGDIRVASDIESAISKVKPDVIFHLAGQVAMTTSLLYPIRDFEINALGSVNLLEGARKYCPQATIVYSSTNKVYGDLESYSYIEGALRYEVADYPMGFAENIPLDFRSPYGCSKGSADQYMLDYARNYSLNTVVFRHSSIFGGRQFSTVDQGWIGWFVREALLKKRHVNRAPFTISGNGKQVRDILHASDLVNCYFMAAKNIKNISGLAFNIGGGYKNSLSLLELFGILGSELGINLHYELLPWRSNDQKVFIADTESARKKFGWIPTIDKLTGIKMMIEWVENSI